MKDFTVTTAGVLQVLSEQLGQPMIVIEKLPAAKNLQDCLGCTSLDLVSIQLACEERFGVKFAEGAHDRGPVDTEWDALTSVGGLVSLLTKYSKEEAHS